MTVRLKFAEFMAWERAPVRTSDQKTSFSHLQNQQNCVNMASLVGGVTSIKELASRASGGFAFLGWDWARWDSIGTVVFVLLALVK